MDARGGDRVKFWFQKAFQEEKDRVAGQRESRTEEGNGAIASS